MTSLTGLKGKRRGGDKQQKVNQDVNYGLQKSTLNCCVVYGVFHFEMLRGMTSVNWKMTGLKRKGRGGGDKQEKGAEKGDSVTPGDEPQ